MRTVATAGHVDHGKSTLVQALTGTDPDRLAEEKTRGLTIDLGFAFTTLPSGVEVGFVDVPGHVRFIKNMLAGVGAVDVAVFVVAATEGWRPQTEEHLHILELLGVRHALVTLTKADLVDAELLLLAQLDIEEHLAGSALVDAPVVVCDSRSGRGLDEVRDTLDLVLASTPPPRDVGRPRLWVDRVFAAKGAGTVVTGTLTGGPISLDDELAAGGHPVRVRGLETAGRRAARAEPGARVALNLAGVDHRQLRRGDAVLEPDRWSTTSVVDVAVTVLDGETEKRRRFHAAVGSGEHAVAFRALDGDGRYARLRFASPLPLVPGDRIVLRDTGRGVTVAGAEVLDIRPARRARDATHRLALPLGERLLAVRPWRTVDDLGRDGGLGVEQASDLAAQLVADGVAARVGPWVVDTAALDAARVATRTRVAEHHRDRPHDAGVDVSRLGEGLALSAAQLRAVVEDDPELVIERGVARAASRAGPQADTPAARALVAALAATPFGPPSPADLGVDADLVRALVREGTLVDLDGVVFAVEALDAARRAVIELLATHPTLSVADVRDTLGSTRKYVLPICGWLDRQGITRRRGDDRIAGPASGLNG